MESPIEISGKDIAELSDTDLRTLIGFLCEADFRAENLTTVSITFGGHQNAKDGGLDVVVSAATGTARGFISRSETGIQVKKPKMFPSEIKDEMKPKGVLRPDIEELVKNKGAYIIVSSKDSTSHTALKNRKNAMRESVKGCEDADKLLLDFYDQGRIATWVRNHPSLALWVQNKIGNPTTGWRGYDNWSRSPKGVEDEYLYDEELRLVDDTEKSQNGVGAIKGICRVRETLCRPRSSVRIAGLSGVGKTRFAQALFDERVGNGALNKSQVFYTDISDDPNPEPGRFAEQLVAGNVRAILIIDNCSRDLHERLTKICVDRKSHISVLTIEYDVRDHLPEETKVLRLEPASEELTEKLIRVRFPHISQVDARSVAKFSGGNARIALALAGTVKEGESLSGLKDESLFERLFHQRHNVNEELLLTASVLALVYSFEGSDTVSSNSELSFLGSLIDKDAAELYRTVGLLKNRDLIQSRGVWRAVLPHAIANKLAKHALELIPKDALTKAFINHSSERLVQSFAHRLSFLHDIDIAKEIVGEWLSADGWLGSHIHNLNDFGMKVLSYVAPVFPDKTLATIERAVVESECSDAIFASRKNPKYVQFTRLLWHLAYDRNLFARSVKVLVRFSLTEKPDENNNSIRDILKSLFHIKLSGTHATAEDRAAVVEELIYSEDRTKEELGFSLLHASLEAWHFSGHYEYSFGARPRDYGYNPGTWDEVVDWYSIFIEIAVRAACSEKAISEDARASLANNLRGLWTKGRMADVLIKAATSIQSVKPWHEGWIAVRGIRRFDSKGFDDETLAKLDGLEEILNPKDLIDRARTYISSSRGADFSLSDDFDDEETSGWKRAAQITEKIGQEVAGDQNVFMELLPEMFASESYRIGSFGRGLATGTDNIANTWDMLCKELLLKEEDEKRLGLLIGYLGRCFEIDREFFDSTLDGMIDDEFFGPWFPIFQTAFEIDKKGLDRLYMAIDEDRADISQYKRLAWGKAHEVLSDGELVNFMKRIAAKENGEHVVIELLTMRFHGHRSNEKEYSKVLIDYACEVLAEYSFNECRRSDGSIDYALCEIADVCLKGATGKSISQKILKNIAQQIDDDELQAYHLPKYLNILAELYPFEFLDCFADSNASRYRFYHFDSFERRENPFNKISDEQVIAWCEKQLVDRSASVSQVASLYEMDTQTETYVWKRFVLEFIDRLDDISPLLNSMSKSIWPTGWNGSLADILEKKQSLFEFLFEHENDEVSVWAKTQYKKLQQDIVSERERENERYNDENQTFE